MQYGDRNSSSLSSNLDKLEAAIPRTEGAYASVQILMNTNRQLSVTFQLFDISSKLLLENLSPALDIAIIVMDYKYGCHGICIQVKLLTQILSSLK